MSSSSNTSIAAAVYEIQYSMMMLYKVASVFLFIFGTVGHTLSIYVFTRPVFRLNSCVRYFLASAISGCIVVYTNVPIRMLQIGYGMDVLTYSVPICQIFAYCLLWTRIVPLWFIVLASIDRFLASSSSVKFRRWSSIRVASYAIPITILLISLIHIHASFNLTVVLLPQRSCVYSSNAYRAFFSIWNLIVWSWLPTICILIFGLLTIRNIHQSKKRIIPQGTHSQAQQNQKQLDRQLIRMLVIQCFVFIFTTTTNGICQLYISITNNLMVKNEIAQARDSYLSNAGGLLAIACPCMSSYLFILSSQMFRSELTKLFCRH